MQGHKARQMDSNMITIQDWESGGQYITAGGHRIFLVDEGAPKKGTVFLIHGFPTSSWDWKDIWGRLINDYRLIAPDMLGFGYSDKPERHHYSIHEQADILEAVIQETGLTRFHVLAHDYGDTVAQEMLAQQNEGAGAGQWQSICFLNGGLFPETHQALLIQKLLLSPLGPWVNRLTTKARFDKSFSHVFGPETKPSNEELDAFWTLINHNQGRHIFHNLITYMRDRQTHRQRWIDAIAERKIPAGLINGSFDPVSGAHMVKRFIELLGEPDYLAELPAIGHYPQVEAPDQVINHYRKFLAGLTP